MKRQRGKRVEMHGQHKLFSLMACSFSCHIWGSDDEADGDDKVYQVLNFKLVV